MNSKTTKRVFSEAIYDLLMTMSLNEIHVKDICERSGLSKRTFYYHFSDKYDLAVYMYDTLETMNLKEFLVSNSFLGDYKNGNPILCEFDERSVDAIQRTVHFWHKEQHNAVGINLLLKSDDPSSPFYVRKSAIESGRRKILTDRLKTEGKTLDDLSIELAVSMMMNLSYFFYDRWKAEMPRDEGMQLVKYMNELLEFWVMQAIPI